MSRTARSIGTMLAAGALILTMAPAASAVVSSTPASTWQADGRVRAILRVGSTVYLAGSFTSLSDHSGNSVARDGTCRRGPHDRCAHVLAPSARRNGVLARGVARRQTALRRRLVPSHRHPSAAPGRHVLDGNRQTSALLGERSRRRRARHRHVEDRPLPGRGVQERRPQEAWGPGGADACQGRSTELEARPRHRRPGARHRVDPSVEPARGWRLVHGDRGHRDPPHRRA